MEAARKLSNLLPLLERLGREPLMTDFHLLETPITKLPDEIDRVDKEVDAIQDNDVRKERLKASVERCRECFSLLLLEIPPDKMSEMQKRGVADLIKTSAATTAAIKSVEQQGTPPDEGEMPTLVQLRPTPTPPPRMPPGLPSKGMPPPSLKMAPKKPEPPKPVDSPGGENESPQVPEPESSFPLPTPIPAPTAMPALTPGAQFWSTAATLIHDTPLSLAPGLKDRLVWQFHLHSLELECQKKLEPGLRQLWNTRKTAILSLFDPATLTLTEKTRDYLNAVQSQHPDWIQPFEVSGTWLQMMFRFWLSETTFDAFQPSLAESGFLFAFLGSVNPLIDNPNPLNLEGLNEATAQELLCRLNRLHRIRNLIISSREILPANVSDRVSKDLETCFSILSTIRPLSEPGGAHG